MAPCVLRITNGYHQKNLHGREGLLKSADSHWPVFYFSELPDQESAVCCPACALWHEVVGVLGGSLKYTGPFQITLG